MNAPKVLVNKVIDKDCAPDGMSEESVERLRTKQLGFRNIMTVAANMHGVELVESDAVERGSSSVLRPGFFEEMDVLREAAPDVVIPKTLTFEDYRRDPFFPVMVKYWMRNGGLHKYLIDDEGQWKKFEKWMDEHGESENWVFQEFIECPSDHYASLRVIVTATREPLVTQIIYGSEKDYGVRISPEYGFKHSKQTPRHMLADPDSEFFLNSKNVRSNVLFRGRIGKGGYPANKGGGGREMVGGRIVIDPITPDSHPWSNVERNIAWSHGLYGGLRSLDAPRLPDEIRQQTAAFAAAICLNKETGVVDELAIGVDYVKRERGGVWNLLEVNRRPRLVSIRDLLGSAERYSESYAFKVLLDKVFPQLVEGRHLQD